MRKKIYNFLFKHAFLYHYFIEHLLKIYYSIQFNLTLLSTNFNEKFNFVFKNFQTLKFLIFDYFGYVYGFLQLN